MARCKCYLFCSIPYIINIVHMTYNLIEHENTNSMGFLKIHKNQNRNMLNHLCDYKDIDYFGTSIV